MCWLLQKLQNTAYALANTLQGANIADTAQPTAAATAGMQASSGASSVPQWSTDPSLQQPAGASSALGQQGSYSSSAQPMAASAYAQSNAGSAAGEQGASSDSVQPMAAAVPASAATSAIPWTTSASGQVPLSASMQDSTSGNAVADEMQHAVQNTRNTQAAQPADSASSMAAPMQQQAAGVPSGPAVTLGSSNAAPVQPAQQQSSSTPSELHTKQALHLHSLLCMHMLSSAPPMRRCPAGMLMLFL